MSINYVNTKSITYSEDNECYSNLANAIIYQAVEDYRKAIRDKFESKNCDINRRMKRDCLKFFRSEYFQLLTNISGEDIINQLNKEKEEEDANKNIKSKKTYIKVD